MTNIVAVITFVVVTNWQTVTIHGPVSPAPVHVYQVGTVTTNKLLSFEFDGKKHQVLIDSVDSPDKLTRSVSEIDLKMPPLK